MTLWKIITVLSILVPVWAVALGGLCWCCPPQGPTWAFGYRSRRARASDDSWQFAQDMAGKIWTLLGIVMLAGSLLYCAALKEAPAEELVKQAGILILVQNVCILISMIPVEIQLLRLFDRFGRRRGTVTREPKMPTMPAQEFEPTGPLELPPQLSVDYAQPTEYGPEEYRDPEVFDGVNPSDYVTPSEEQDAHLGFEAAGEFAPPVEFPVHGAEDDVLPISDSAYFDDPDFSDPVEFSQADGSDDGFAPISDSAYFGSPEFQDPAGPSTPDEDLPISDSGYFEPPRFQDPHRKPLDPFHRPEDFRNE